MAPRAYYNEIDPGAAETLRQLIKGGHIADGDVDERSKGHDMTTPYTTIHIGTTTIQGPADDMPVPFDPKTHGGKDMKVKPLEVVQPSQDDAQCHRPA